MKKRFYIFGGYDGDSRLNDFHYFILDDRAGEIPPSSLLLDMQQFVNAEKFSDITFVLEGNKHVYGHKMLLSRCPYFTAMFASEMKESLERKVRLPRYGGVVILYFLFLQVTIENISHDIFLLMLRYLYTDDCEITLENAMELFEAADIYGIDRLKSMCEQTIISSIDIDNAAAIFHASDMHHAQYLREMALNYILEKFDDVSKV